MQPTYNSWLGYFDMIDQSDVFILYDDVQISKQSWQVRNKIKDSNGPFFLNIPYVKTENWRELRICDAKTNEQLNWRGKHLKSIEASYRKAPFFTEVIPFIWEMYQNTNTTIGSFNECIIRNISKKIGITTEIINSSVELSDIEGTKDLRLARICEHLGSTFYLSPQGAASYIEKTSPGGELAKHNVKVYYHDYMHPLYSQMSGDFISHMGVIDLLFNVGFADSLNVIRSGRANSLTYKEIQN